MTAVQTESGETMARDRGAVNTPSERVRPDDLPAVALAELLALGLAHRPGRPQRAPGASARPLPGVRDIAREKRAGAGPADAHLVADLERDLAGEHPGNLVA